MNCVEYIRDSLESDLRLGTTIWWRTEKRQREELNYDSSSTKESYESKGKQPFRLMLYCDQEVVIFALMIAYC